MRFSLVRAALPIEAGPRAFLPPSRLREAADAPIAIRNSDRRFIGQSRHFRLGDVGAAGRRA
jgi:hypothetical protein